MDNPFESLNRRLSNIENIIIDIKHDLSYRESVEPIETPIGVEEAAEFLRIKVPTLYALTSKQEVPFNKRSGRLYFLKSELLEYIRTGRQKTNAEQVEEAENFVDEELSKKK
jgi:excisionase family DNA binding protein